MKWLIDIIGGILILIGGVWFFQGINLLPGSFMTGNPVYAILGALAVIIGVLVIVIGNRGSRKKTGGQPGR
jgi:hypothetical protein